MTATFLVGDVRARMADLEDGSFDLILCSPPFLALRSYLPDGHPDKHLEIGSEATPAEFLDTMLELTAEWGRLLAPHGSIAIELGDTYAGSGGAGGDYNPAGLRDGQNKFRLTRPPEEGYPTPLEKSLMGIPQLYQIAITYGINPLTGQKSPAGRWRVRNLKAWIRSNPPVGALGDKERPATSYIIVACRATDRWFDLDAVRTAPAPHTARYPRDADHYSNEGYDVDSRGDGGRIGSNGGNAGGAPPRDWTHTVDLILDTELANRAGKTAANRRTAKGVDRQPRTGKSADRGGDWHRLDELAETDGAVGAQGVHLRRALENAGILTPQDFYDISPKGYRGAHYAVWPPELARRLIDEMCPRHVCVVCGEPRRRLTEREHMADYSGGGGGAKTNASVQTNWREAGVARLPERKAVSSQTVGWSDCGHNQYRPGRVLDPFVGSGTTLAVASGMARDSVGIDLDYTNVGLALERVGMWLHVTWPPSDFTLLALGAGHHASHYIAWITDQDAKQILETLIGAFHQGTRPRPTVLPTRYVRPTPPAQLPGQVDLFDVVESL